MKNFHDIIAEAGRHKHHHKGGNKNRHFEEENDLLPERESIRKPHRREKFELLDRLAPLKRWLAKQVNRPWDKVWAEVSSMIPDTVAGNHIRSHVLQEVELNVVMVPGKKGRMLPARTICYGWQSEPHIIRAPCILDRILEVCPGTTWQEEIAKLPQEYNFFVTKP